MVHYYTSVIAKDTERHNTNIWLSVCRTSLQPMLSLVIYTASLILSLMQNSDQAVLTTSLTLRWCN